MLRHGRLLWIRKGALCAIDEDGGAKTASGGTATRPGGYCCRGRDELPAPDSCGCRRPSPPPRTGAMSGLAHLDLLRSISSCHPITDKQCSKNEDQDEPYRRQCPEGPLTAVIVRGIEKSLGILCRL